MPASLGKAKDTPIWTGTAGIANECSCQRRGAARRCGSPSAPSTTAYTLYCNGRQLASYGDKATYSTSRIGTITEISAGLQFGEDNLIAVDVFDWARSGGLWKPPCLMTTDPAELPVAVEVQAHLWLRGRPVNRRRSPHRPQPGPTRRHVCFRALGTRRPEPVSPSRPHRSRGTRQRHGPLSNSPAEKPRPNM